jgi:hypothetical protein
MAKSVREIARVMNAPEWASASSSISTRVLLEGHRWDQLAPAPRPASDSQSRYPGASLSLREIVRRHSHPETQTLRLLSYNTYLLRGFAIPWDNWILAGAAGGFEGVLLALGSDVMAAIAAVAAPDFSIPVPILSDLKSELKDNLPDGLVDLFLPGPDSISLRELLSAGLSPAAALTLVMKTLNLTPTSVLAALGVSLPAGLGAKPALDFRARTIGAVLASMRYEIVACCEVWEQPQIETLAEHVMAGPFQYTMHPEGTGVILPPFKLSGDGLRVFVRTKFPSANGGPTAFDEQGERLRDADAWANKGYLRTSIDLGASRIELFSLHTLSGGQVDLVDGDKTPEQKESDFHQIKMAQVAQVLQHIAAVRPGMSPSTVCVIVGDLNIDFLAAPHHVGETGAEAGVGSAFYEDLRVTMDAAGFTDAWPMWNEPAAERATASGEANVKHTDISCALMSLPNDPAAICDPKNSQHGSAEFGRGSGFDYIFVDKALPAQGFRVDLSRVLRRPFPLQPAEEGMEFLSDHMGLEITLVVSPNA